MIAFEYFDARIITINREGITMDLPDSLHRLPSALSVGIDIAFEQTGLAQVYRHRDYSWVAVLGTTYRVRWRPPFPRTPVSGHEIHGRRWLTVHVWGIDDPILFQISLQELPRLPAGSQRF